MDFSTLSARLDAGVFAHLSEPVTVSGVPRRGMFRAPWLGPRLGKQATGVLEPEVVLREADAAGVAQGAAVTVGGRDYRVVSIEPDGTGLTALILREVVL